MLEFISAIESLVSVSDNLVSAIVLLPVIYLASYAIFANLLTR